LITIATGFRPYSIEGLSQRLVSIFLIWIFMVTVRPWHLARV
jgi:hypothetical protein